MAHAEVNCGKLVGAKYVAFPFGQTNYNCSWIFAKKANTEHQRCQCHWWLEQRIPIPGSRPRQILLQNATWQNATNVKKVFFPSFYSAQNVLKLSPLLSPSLFQLISLRGKLLPKRISFSPSLPPFLSLILIFFLSLSFSSFLSHFSLALSSTHSHLFNSSSLSISLFLFLSLVLLGKVHQM